MAEFKATAQLNIETLTDKAQSDILALSELMNRKLNPGESGEFSPTQDAALDQGVQQRAAALTAATGKEVTPEKVKKTLQEISALEDEIKNKLDARDLAQGRLNEKLAKAKEEEQALNDYKKQANDILGIQAETWREINKRAREILKDDNATEEQKKNAQEALNLYKENTKAAQRFSRANAAVTEAQEQLNVAQKEYDKTAAKIKRKLESLAVTDEEREEIQTELLKDLESELKLRKQNLEAAKESKRLANAEEKVRKDIAEAEGDIKDSFAGKITSAFLYYQALNAVKRVVRDAIRTITELDRALTDIAVVTSFSREESWALLGTYQEMAKQVGLTTTEVANLSIAFFRQGREAKDALELTRTAAEFARIAAINVNDAANFLTAAINGFNLSASDATRIIDRFAALGAGAAASAQEIAIALSKVAPAAASAGVEVDTLMAFVTKGIETTREAPENIGTAFKTVFARMRQLTDIGTTIEDGVNVNRVEDSLKSIGVELRDANGFFRDLDDVLIDVGKRWDSINRNQQAYIATTLAGTRQQTRLIALFEDFDRTLDLVEISQDSAGAAAIQHAEFMTGLEASTTRLRTSFQQLITSFVNSDIVIGAINAINTVLEMMNTFLGKTVLTVATLLTSFQLLTKSDKVQGFFKGLYSALSPDKAQAAVAGYFSPITKAANGMFAVFQYGVAKSGKIFPLMGQYFQTFFGNGVRGPIIATRKAYEKLLSALLNTAFGQKMLLPLWNKLTISTNANTAATAANSAAAATNPYVLIAAAIAVVILGLALFVKKIRDADNTTSKLVSAWKQFFDNIARGIKKAIDSIVGFIDRIITGFKEMPEWLKTTLNILMLFVPGLRLIGAYNLTKSVLGALGINLQRPISKAASELRVLKNQAADLNKEIAELRGTIRKLETAIDTYVELSNIIFRTKKETEDLIRAQENLQEILGTEATGEGLAIIARAELAKQEADLERQARRVTEMINEYFAENQGIDWEEFMASDQFAEFEDVFYNVAIEQMKSMITGYEDMAPDLQAAFIAATTVDPGAVMNAMAPVLTKSMKFVETNLTPYEEGVDASVLIGPGTTQAEAEAMIDATPRFSFIDKFFAKRKLSRAFGEVGSTVDFATIYQDSITSAVNIINTADNDFVEAVAASKELDLESLPENIQNAVDLIAPSIRTLESLDTDLAQAIQDAGGMQVFTQIKDILDSLSSVTEGAFQDITDVNGDIIKTAAEQQKELNMLLIQAASSGEGVQAFVDMWEEASANLLYDDKGNILGTSIGDLTFAGQEAANAIITGLRNQFSNIDIPLDRIELITKDFQKLSEILQKSPAALTNEDIDLLSRYDGLLTDYMNGTVKPLSEYFQDITNSVLQTIQYTEEQIRASRTALQIDYEDGRITQETFETEMARLDTLNATNNLAKELLNFNNQDLDAIKAQIDAYKASFDQAKKIHDLQKEAVALTEKSIQAIRTGATGTIEAEFNRAKLNQEIADANRQLEQNLIMAQLEAQQKVLEDAQQRRILEITDENTTATGDNTTAINVLSGIMQAFLNSDNTITIGTGTLAVTMSIEEYMEQFNQWLAMNGTS